MINVQIRVQAMQGGGGMGGGSGGGGPQVLRLTEEEMAAVNRLVDMGFDRTEAAEAYLACDKNEALAANLLMDGGFGGGDGGGFDFDDNPGNNGDGGSGDDGNDNGDGDDMYD
jgi:UV excision repair protein RAD23